MGLGEKQDDDILHNYTVAKITCDCDFDLNSEVLDIEGGTNITTAATGNKVTINMSGSFATEDFATAIAVALG